MVRGLNRSPWFSSWWFQPIWKILVKLDHFPQVGVKIKSISNHQPVFNHSRPSWLSIRYIFRASKSRKLTLNPSFCIRKMVLATTSLYLGGIGGSVWHLFQMAKLRGVRNGGDPKWDDPPITLFVVTCDPHVIYVVHGNSVWLDQLGHMNMSRHHGIRYK